MDSTDRKILWMLQGNARMTNQEIGDRLGISRVAAMKRVRKLEQQGIIRGYNTYICLEEETTVLIDLLTTPDGFEDVMNYCLNDTAYIRQIFRTTLKNHIHMVAVSESAYELRYLIDRIRKDCADKIVEFKSHAVKEVVKDVYGGIRNDEWRKSDSE